MSGAVITRISKEGAPLTKTIRPAGGKLVSDHSEQTIARGTAMRVPVADANAMADVINGLAKNQAIVPGRFTNDASPEIVPLATADNLRPGEIARSKQHIDYRAGQSAYVLLDCDFKGAPDAVVGALQPPGALWAAIARLAPEMASASRVERPSTSAGIFDPIEGTEYPGSGGRHIYVRIDDGADAKHLIDTLHDLAWAAGYGWYWIGDNGALHERSIIDRAVSGGERICYEADPILEGLCQDKAARIAIAIETGISISAKRIVVPPGKARIAAELKPAARAEREQYAKPMRDRFTREYAETIARRDGVTVESMIPLLDLRYGGDLHPSMSFEFDDANIGTVTGYDILANPDKFKGKTLRCPTEPTYGRCKAKVMGVKDGTVIISSYAHGLHTLRLRPPLDVVFQHVGVEAPTTSHPPPPPPLGDTDNPLDRLLDASMPSNIALHFINQRWMLGEFRALHCWQGVFYRWTGSAYAEVPAEQTKAQIQAFLDHAEEDRGKPFKTKLNDCREVEAALRNRTQLAARPPCWIGDTNTLPAHEIVAVRNGLLHLPSGQLLPATPSFFNLTALPFDYDPAAPLPLRWLSFLRSIWPDDPEQIEALGEAFGYLVSADTRQQKILLLKGPKRSGKGTIARTATALCGVDNTCAPTIGSLSENFGLESWIGKSLAVISDARLNRGSDYARVLERLLSVSGEDMQTISRKYIQAWSGTLPTRIMYLSNDLPNLHDASGALASRFIVFNFVQSFIGQEDHGLGAALADEMPGILNWAVAGYARLHQRGRLRQPKSSAHLVEMIEQLAAPVAMFVRDNCIVGTGLECTAAALFTCWQSWCGQQHIRDAGTVQNFARELMSAEPTVRSERRHHDKITGKVTFWQGIDIAPVGAAMTVQQIIDGE